MVTFLTNLHRKVNKTAVAPGSLPVVVDAKVKKKRVYVLVLPGGYIARSICNFIFTENTHIHFTSAVAVTWTCVSNVQIL